MTPLLLNEAFLAKKFLSLVALNAYVPIFRSRDARGGRKLRTDTQTHTRTHARDNYSKLQYTAHAGIR